MAENKIDDMHHAQFFEGDIPEDIIKDLEST